MLKLLSFNAQGMWSDAIDFLATIIAEHDPDFVFLQEVRVSDSYDPLSLLQERFSSHNVFFSSVFDFSTDYGKWVLQYTSVEEWLCILTKHAVDIEYRSLPIIAWLDRRPRGIQTFVWNTLSFSHIHMSKFAESRKKSYDVLPDSDIIIGDFNMQLDEVSSYFASNYTIAYTNFPYISYPHKNLTLDHCVVRDWKFLSVKSIENTVSDHNAVVYDLAVSG